MSESIDKIKQVESFLESMPKFSTSGKSATNFDLSRMRKFCEVMGNPQDNFKSIHVGGTNGKGTVCRMLASVYQEAGYNVGLYTSPHLVDVRERFQINAMYIESDDFLEFFEKFGKFIQQMHFTYFEITTAIAFWYFSKKTVDIAILEVGLGGRLDATNVVEPLMSVITSIGFDHTDILGDSIEEIAFEKAGIIKQNAPVVVGNLEPDALSIIQNIAKERSSELMTVDILNPEFRDKKILLRDESHVIIIDGINWKHIDAINTAIVFRIVKKINSDFHIEFEDIKKGIENVEKRFQKRAVFEKLLPDYDWYFDGAHNVQSVQALTAHLIERTPACKWIVVLSFMKDKLNFKIAELWNNFDNIYIYPMERERAATLNEMKIFFPSASILNTADLLDLDQFKTELVIFSGSFYFYSVVSNWMGAIASADQSNPSAL